MNSEILLTIARNQQKIAILLEQTISLLSDIKVLLKDKEKENV